MIRKVGIVVNLKKKNAAQILKRITLWLRRRKIEVISDLEVPREEIPERVDLIIALGGDGTLLNIAKFAAASFNNPLILGVNLGGLGFITETALSEARPYLEKILKGKFTVTRRMVMKATYVSPGLKKNYFALNDIVVSKGALSRIINLKVDVGGEYLGSYLGDGLIISTTTGSTAHSLAAGGPIVHPELDSIIITPICPHTLSNRPLVIPSGLEVRIEASEHKGSGEVAVMVDGQLGFSLNREDKVLIKSAKRKLRLIGSPTLSYFQILREKLGWQVRRYHK